ncbi:glycoside hydrolase family 88 protein [Dyadobacter subterraneus]|uniref:Glycoside hydrolase family 88 protein n=1 Tax=Dyadobacter subterraneus TaxID=2773304 RepID=A0ABR9W4V5_9BACT|nr:glycoside hydrolase family 88 protein [Dyadobacter subterraneus]MBE9460478.1 glycoside hydrolase family 88 protein [Dyadobacter subterraneus]
MERRKALGILLAGSALTNVWARETGSSKIDKKQLLKSLRLANNYFVNKWPDTGKSIITNRERPSNIWTRAVYYEGLMALYQIDPQKSYYDYAVSWGENHKWGLRNGIQTRNGDDQCCGQTYIDLYLIDKKEERIKDIKASIDLMVASEKVSDWTWIDALQMAMPVYAKLGTIYKDDRYFEKMYALYIHTKTKEGGNGLYNPEEKLWWRDKDFLPPYKTPAGKNCYWSRGNGWIVAALVRVLEIMPKDAPHRAEYQTMLLDMLAALLPLQRTDGYWNVSLTDQTDFGGKEVSGTSLFIYGMAWAINNGLVKAKTYNAAIVKAWNAMQTECLHPDGFLGFVQGTGKEPKDGQPVTYDSKPDFEDYGLGCFLLAGTEIYKMKLI